MLINVVTWQIAPPRHSHRSHYCTSCPILCAPRLAAITSNGAALRHGGSERPPNIPGHSILVGRLTWDSLSGDRVASGETSSLTTSVGMRLRPKDKWCPGTSRRDRYQYACYTCRDSLLENRQLGSWIGGYGTRRVHPDSPLAKYSPLSTLSVQTCPLLPSSRYL